MKIQRSATISITKWPPIFGVKQVPSKIDLCSAIKDHDIFFERETDWEY